MSSQGDRKGANYASVDHFASLSVAFRSRGTSSSKASVRAGLSVGAAAINRAAHAQCVERGVVSGESYMGSNASEYWAESAQAWFEATVRCDVNCGLNTREELALCDWASLGKPVPKAGAHGGASDQCSCMGAGSCRRRGAC